jgi:hypothetical protein
MDRRKMHSKYFTRRKIVGKEPEERSHEGRTGMAHTTKEYSHVGPTC